MKWLKGFSRRLADSRRPTPPPTELLLRDMAIRVRLRLTAMGHYRRRKDGTIQEVQFLKPLGLSGGRRFGFLVVDTMRLPQGVKLIALADPKVLKELSWAIGKPIRAAAKDGSFLYVIDLRPEERQKLPRRVEFDLGQRPDGEYMVPLGLTTEGPLWASLLDIHHVLIAGATGSGKSNMLHGCLCSLLAVYGPDKLKIAIVDPKGGVELAAYNGLPHLMEPIATDVEGAEDIIRHLGYEMESRQALLKGKGVRDWNDYNRLVGVDEELPLIVVIIDEFLALTTQAGGSALNIPFARGLAWFVTQARAPTGSFAIQGCIARPDTAPGIATNCATSPHVTSVRKGRSATLAGVPRRRAISGTSA